MENNSSDPNSKEVLDIMQRSTQKMKDTTKLLKQAEFLVEDTHRIADDTLVELGKQKEVIQKIDERVRETDTEINDSSRIIKKIKDGVMKQKMAMFGVGGLLAGLAVVVGIKVAK
jgi:hypothetical protein